MTQDELITMLKDQVKAEYQDVIRYVRLSKAATDEGHKQILRDIAREELLHAEHIERLLDIPDDNTALREEAQRALDGI